MKQIYTEDDVIRYVYGEMDEEEYPVFFEVLCKDAVLWQMFESLQQLKSELGESLQDPSDATCRAIMEEVNRMASEVRVSQTVPAKKSPSPYALFPTGLVLGLFIAGAGFALQQIFLSSDRPHKAELSADDHAWMYDRLYRMEDDRVLPEIIGTDAYRLVRYSDAGYSDGASIRFE
jgi:hypothetical protein